MTTRRAAVAAVWCLASAMSLRASSAAFASNRKYVTTMRTSGRDLDDTASPSSLPAKIRTEGRLRNLSLFGLLASKANEFESSITPSNRDITVRDWQPGDGPSILELVRSSLPVGAFDPEGDVTQDVITEARIAESYDSEDGSCLLVARSSKDDDEIIGVAALLVGTSVAYNADGSSTSSMGRSVGAVRRLCFREDDVGIDLLSEIESRARAAGAEELIALAYPGTCARGSVDVFKNCGFEDRPEQQVSGIDAVAMGKDLSKLPLKNISSKVVSEKKGGNNPIIGAALGITLALLMLCSAVVVSSSIFGEFALGAGDDNGGLGVPLSSQQLQQLMNDEQLQRTSMTDGDDRLWEDLTPEERREEGALMKIIQGQSVRQGASTTALSY